jgi:DNA-binding Lrp family transcriptional regulator
MDPDMEPTDDLAHVQEKEARIKRLESELEKAKDDYHSAIGQMHVDGKSMREIAKLLNLSHQRVHQIIEAENHGWRAWIKPAKPELRCSFCNLRADQVQKLVQGPTIFVCDICITSCHIVLTTNCPGHSVLSGGNAFKKLLISSGLRCSFCSKSPSRKREIVAGDKHQICAKCIGMAMKYMEEAQALPAKPGQAKPIEPPLKKMIVTLRLRIERNSKWVRGIKRTIEDIEFFVLPQYLRKTLSDREYELEISYEDDKDLDKQINDILMECHHMADSRNCFSESDIKENGTERYWD